MSNKRVQFRRGTSSDHSSFTGASGEVTVDTTNTSIRVHDNSTAGGIEAARADLENISPDQAVDFNGQKLSNIATPVATTDAATKAYVDASFAGGNLSQLTDVSLSSLSSGELIAYNGSNWVNVAVSGDATLASNGVLAISADAIESSMIVDGAVGTDQIATSAVTNSKIEYAYISVTDGSTSSNITLGNALTFAATANQTTVSQSNGTLTVGLADDVTVAATLTVVGNLIVSGTTTTVNTATVSIQDNIMTLNSDATGSPTENAGIEIERGDSANTVLRWNETSDEWEVTSDGSNYYEIAHAGNAGSVTETMLTTGCVTTLKLDSESVTESRIANDAVTTDKLANDAVTNAKIADDAVDSAQIADGAVVTAAIGADAVTNAKIADDAVGAEHIDFLSGTINGTAGSVLVGNGSSAFAQVSISGDATLASDGSITIANSAVETAMIDDSAVSTAKIADSAVTAAKIGASAVETAKINDLAVTTAKLADDNVTPAKVSFVSDSLSAASSGHFLVTDGTNGFTNVAMSGDATLASNGAITIANSAVETAMIADANVTNAKMAANSVGTSNIIDANVTNAKLASNAVATSNIVDDAVTQAKINAGAVGTTELATDAVTSAKITDASVTTAKIADANVTTAKIADDSVTQGKIASGAVGTTELANSAVTETQLAASVAGSGLSGGAGSALSVNVDDATVEFNGGGDIAIKASGVSSAKIADAAIVEAKIASGAVTTAKIASAAITTTLIADSNVTTAKIADSAVTNGKLANSTITFSADSGTADAVSLGETVAIVGTTNEIETSVTNNQIQIGLPSSVVLADLNVTGDVSLGGSSDFSVSSLVTMNNATNIVEFTANNGVVVNGPLKTDAAITRMVTNATSSLSLGDTHHVVFFSGAGITVTIPTAVGRQGREYVLHNTDGSNSVTVSSTGSEISTTPISSGSLATSQKVTIISDGTVWREI